jgi:hypothetical protein
MSEFRDCESPSRKRGRKPLGDLPMTATERQQRRRARIKGGQPAHGTELAFRLALLRFVENQQMFFPGLSTDRIRKVLEQLGTAIRMDEYQRSVGHSPFWKMEYLQMTGLFDPGPMAYGFDRRAASEGKNLTPKHLAGQCL